MRFALIAIALCAAATPAAAATRPPLEHLGRVPPNAGLTDRWVTSQAVPDALRVYDVVARARHDVALGRACRLRSTHRWLALVACERPLDRWPGSCDDVRLVMLHTRALLRPDVGDGGTGWGCDPYTDFRQVGVHWLAGGSRQFGPRASTTFVNWRTGERRHGSEDGSPGTGVGPNPDLDDPRLRSRPTYFGWAEGDVRVPYPRAGGPLLLRRRGERTVVLSRCRFVCRSPGLAGGRVVWREGWRTVRAYVVRGGRRWRWRLPRPATGEHPDGDVATTRWATLVTLNRPGMKLAYVIRWAR